MNKPDLISLASMTDEEVIDRTLNGEKELYALIVKRYNQRLYRVGMSILNDDVEVEEAMQVAYINAYESLHKFEFRSSFSTWLTRILINESYLRIKKRNKSVLLNDDRLETAMQFQQQVESRTPMTKIINTELKQILNDAIRRLPEKYRVVFVLREIENMNVSETMECLDITEVNVKVRLNRAKAMLRQELAGYYQTSDILPYHLTRCDKMVQFVLNYIQNN